MTSARSLATLYNQKNCSATNLSFLYCSAYSACGNFIFSFTTWYSYFLSLLFSTLDEMYSWYISGQKWTKCIIVLVLRLIAQRYISPGAIILAVWIHCGRMSHRIKCLPHLFAALLPPSLNQHSVLDNLCAKNY